MSANNYIVPRSEQTTIASILSEVARCVFDRFNEFSRDRQVWLTNEVRAKFPDRANWDTHEKVCLRAYELHPEFFWPIEAESPEPETAHAHEMASEPDVIIPAEHTPETVEEPEVATPEPEIKEPAAPETEQSTPTPAPAIASESATQRKTRPQRRREQRDERAREERIQKIANNLRYLMRLQPGERFNVRIKTRSGVVNGSFSDYDAAARVIVNYDSNPNTTAVWASLNPLDETIAGVATNQMGTGQNANGENIKSRRWFLVDIDPNRSPKDSCSTDEEKGHALAVTKRVREELTKLGFPEPVFIDSGNGYQLRYLIDLPNNDQSTALIEGCLEALNALFGIKEAKVDTSVGDAPRVGKFPGTWQRKGPIEPVAGRPWSMSSMLSGPDEPTLVTASLLQKVRNLLPPPARTMAEKIKGSRKRKSIFDFDGWKKSAEEKRPDLVFTDSGEWKDGVKRCVLNVCPLNAEHDNHSCAVLMVQRETGYPTFRCEHDGCKGKTFEDVRDIIESPDWRKNDPFSISSGDEDGGTTKASRIVNVLLTTHIIELFHDDHRTAYATARLDDHIATYSVESGEFKHWLQATLMDIEGALPAALVGDVCNALAALAKVRGKRYSVFLRVGRDSSTGNLYIDLGREDWQIVAVTHDGWRIIEYQDCPVKIRRSPIALAFPLPERGGSVDLVWKYLNCHEDDRALLAAYIIYSNAQPHMDHPILGLHAIHGAGKTTQNEMIMNMIDPSPAYSRTLEEKPRNLVVGTTQNWLLAYDNVGSITKRISDYLCRMATGAFFSEPQFYVNFTETSFSVIRPILLNGISEPITENDLRDRTVFVRMIDLVDESPKGEEKQRIDKEDLWAAFRADHPKIFGLILDALVRGLRDYPSVKPKRVMRMSTFARFAMAALPAIGISAEAFLTSYSNNRQESHHRAVEDSSILTGIAELAGEAKWTGTMEDLRRALAQRLSTDFVRSPLFPKSPLALRKMLDAGLAALKSSGIVATMDRTKAARLLTLERIDGKYVGKKTLAEIQDNRDVSHGTEVPYEKAPGHVLVDSK